MRQRVAQYLNEIVSLTIMALMCVALVSAQAGAGQRVEAEDRLASEIEFVELVEIDGVIDTPEWKIDVDFSFRHTGE